jgi:hypothetical protein
MRTISVTREITSGVTARRATLGIRDTGLPHVLGTTTFALNFHIDSPFLNLAIGVWVYLLYHPIPQDSLIQIQ